MAKRMNDGVELIKTLAGTGRVGSRPKPPKAVVRCASLEAPRPVPDHEKAIQCLTANTVAFSARRAAMGFGRGAVDGLHLGRVEHRQPGEDRLPDASLRPPIEPVINCRVRGRIRAGNLPTGSRCAKHE